MTLSSAFSVSSAPLLPTRVATASLLRLSISASATRIGTALRRATATCLSGVELCTISRRSSSVSTLDDSIIGSATDSTSRARASARSCGRSVLAFRLCESASRTRTAASLIMTRKMSSAIWRSASFSTESRNWPAILSATSARELGDGFWRSRLMSCVESLLLMAPPASRRRPALRATGRTPESAG